MNIASLELCKELYELSDYNFDGTDYRWYCLPITITKGSSPELDYSNWQVKHVSYRGKYSVIHYPAYDLGFLLRKLPETTSITKQVLNGIGARHQYNAGWQATETRWSGFEADTPEDALCSLAIELFKQKVLK
jgi:hypothetical protein